MVRRSFTAVLERNAVLNGNFETEPYEAGWASEARFFIRILEIDSTQSSLIVVPQISPDGLIWCDYGPDSYRMQKTGLYSFLVTGFGQWLRLRGNSGGGGVKVMIYLALKE